MKTVLILKKPNCVRRGRATSGTYPGLAAGSRTPGFQGPGGAEGSRLREPGPESEPFCYGISIAFRLAPFCLGWRTKE
jgi:hypothetical protein